MAMERIEERTLASLHSKDRETFKLCRPLHYIGLELCHLDFTSQFAQILWCHFSSKFCAAEHQSEFIQQLLPPWYKTNSSCGVTVPMSYDHKPCQLKEKKRIQVKIFLSERSLEHDAVDFRFTSTDWMIIMKIAHTVAGGRRFCCNERSLESPGRSCHQQGPRRLSAQGWFW